MENLYYPFLFYPVIIPALIGSFVFLVLPPGRALADEPSTAAGEEAGPSKTLPSDVYPETGFRLPLPKWEDFDDEGKKVFDSRVGSGSRSLRGLRGPSGIRMYSPKLAAYLNLVSRYLRFESGFSGRIRELAILVTAREMDSQFEWAAHEAEALKEGLPEDIVEIIKHRGKLAGLPEPDATIIEFGRQMFGNKTVNSETFARALKIFGPRQLVDLVHLMTNYAATAYVLGAFDAQLDPSQEPLLPVP